MAALGCRGDTGAATAGCRGKAKAAQAPEGEPVC